MVRRGDERRFRLDDPWLELSDDAADEERASGSMDDDAADVPAMLARGVRALQVFSPRQAHVANAVTSSRPRARSTSSSTSVVPGKLASSPRGEDTYAITRDPELESHLADLQVRAAKESDPKESGPLLAECSRLRAIAAVAIALAHVHGRLAWFLAAATPLTPVLHRRALPDENSPTSGAVAPTPAQYTEAEDAVRRLQNALAGISTA